MDFVLGFFKEFVNLGAAVMLPVVIALLGILFRMRPSQAIRSGLLVGIGFQGIVLIITFLLSTMQPVFDFYKVLGSGYDVAEIGFAALGGASWTAPYAIFVIPAIILVNIILIRLKWTKVLNVDIWNFMHFLVPGALAWVLFDSPVIGFLVTLALSVIDLFIAEWCAPQWGEFFGLEGTACTCLGFIVYEYPLAMLINKIIDVIPGINKIDLNIEKLSSKIGILGDPAIIGLFVGLFLGVLTQQDLASILKLMAGMAAVLVLIPRMVSIMMEGLSPIGAGASEFANKHLDADSEIYVGMDIALGLGDPACITCTSIMIPITVGLSFLIPGMRFFPAAILAEVCYVSPMAVLASKGNIFRTLVIMTVFMYLMLFFANMFAPYATEMLRACGVDFGGGLVTASHFGYNPGCLIVEFIAKLLGI
ncbi:PTS transporter subunit IIC [Olsenella sp. HMSC062G07]|uniref:PTS transporter subunit IIC n=1 Tax=Olsenella sp. HMSC062G07 TaxID=1739330 RepID=UPI0008A52ECD|nr:PTS transporter subunit IIC [Olsenella sp. HMSC062G07]OFK23420.1 PTS galactitol transporter subunit IIC [Olsenella sp. HMSC062G07]